MTQLFSFLSLISYLNLQHVQKTPLFHSSLRFCVKKKKMSSVWVLTLLLSIVGFYTVPLVKAAYCYGKPHDGTPNTTPLWNQPHTLLKTVKNGKLYQAGNVTTNSTLYVVHVYGTDYEMGYAHGQVLRVL